MSLEQAIDRLTSAVEANTRAIQTSGGMLLAPGPERQATTLMQEPTQAQTAPSEPKPRGRPPGTGKSPAAAGMGPPATAQVQELTYPDVQQAIMHLAQVKGHSVAMATLGKFGVTHGKQLTQDQWPAALKELKAAVGAIA